MSKIKFDELIKVFKKYVDKEGRFNGKRLKYVYNDGNNLIASNSYAILRVGISHVADIPQNFVEGELYCPYDKDVKSSITSYPISLYTLKTAYNTSDLKVILNGKAINEFYGYIRNDFRSFKKDIETSKNFFEMVLHKQYMEIRTAEHEKILSQNTLKHVEVECSDSTAYIVGVNFRHIRDAIMTCRKLKLDDNKDITMHVSRRYILFSYKHIFDILVLPMKKL